VASGPPGSGSFSLVFLSQPDPSPRTLYYASSVADCRPRRLHVVAAHRLAPPHFFPCSPSPFYSSSSSKRKLLPPLAIAAALRAPMTTRHATPLPCRREAIKRVHAHLLPLPVLTTPPRTLGADQKSFPYRRSERYHHLTGHHRAPSCRQRCRPPHRGPGARAAASHEPAN
jgi:hypothetical protein